jgi:sulfur carrier protein ThiS
MKIQVSCFATLSRYTPPEGYLEAEKSDTPAKILDRLGIPREEVKIVFVNGQNSGLDVVLNENDRVGIFPAIGGG